MISRQHNSICPANGYPTARFSALTSLIDHRQVETPVAEQIVIQAGGCCTQDVCCIKNVLYGLSFQASCIGQKRFGFGSHFARRQARVWSVWFVRRGEKGPRHP